MKSIIISALALATITLTSCSTRNDLQALYSMPRPLTVVVRGGGEIVIRAANNKIWEGSSIDPTMRNFMYDYNVGDTVK